MRPLVIFLALLAVGKVAAVEWLHRSASEDAIIAAFGPRALDACSRDARRKSLNVDATAWTAGTPIRFELGRPDAQVYLWQVDNPAWAQRYRHPYLVLQSGSFGAQVECAFDVLAGTGIATKH